ncbi:DUF748 domain-containing protein [Pseudenhygromyxa sp. WMMC2535]|uniref:DUF748 domain-containing protein n=1 Tax=Pseudenhygromyxa sp. WMMC2535 TaxID=2712867 RepID=UPI0015566BCE|nr:DUF748 domain-containing protein [Pseudenhygromyxa sp. WMMC2535]NVB39938.1 DUF748 domain-containing protein [Pseudenhygromyxa sp. WMMC2535]
MSSRKRVGLWILGALALALVLVVGVAALFLDAIAQVVVERKFESVEGMTAEVEDTQLEVFDRHLVISGVHLNPDQGGVEDDLIYAERLEIDVFGPMIAGSASESELVIRGLALHFVRSDDPSHEQLISEQALEDIRALSSWDSREITVEDSRARYVDERTGLDLELVSLSGELGNLDDADEDTTPATFALSGEVESGGKVELSGDFAKNGETPRAFSIDAQLEGFRLEAIEPLIANYVGVRVTDGYAALGVHLDGEGGDFGGWIEPHFSKVKMKGELEDGLKRPLIALGIEIGSSVVEDPLALGPNNNIEVEGSYGDERGFSLQATDENNSWLQEKLLKIGDARERVKAEKREQEAAREARQDDRQEAREERQEEREARREERQEEREERQEERQEEREERQEEREEAREERQEEREARQDEPEDKS